MKRKQFTFYASFHEAISMLTDDRDRLAMYEAIAGYSLCGEMPVFDSNICDIIWTTILPTLSRQRTKALNGYHGGAPVGNQNARKEKTTEKTTEKQPTENSCFCNTDENEQDTTKKTTKKQPKNNQKTTKKQPKNKQDIIIKDIKDKEKDNNNIIIQKENEKTTSCFDFDILPAYESVFNEWLEYRRKIRKPITIAKSIKTAYNQMVRLSQGDADIARQMVEQSIANQYQGLFELKTQKTTGHDTNDRTNCYTTGNAGKAERDRQFAESIARQMGIKIEK